MVMDRSFRANLVGIEAWLPVDDPAMKAVLDVRLTAALPGANHTPLICLIAREERAAARRRVQGPWAKPIAYGDRTRNRQLRVVRHHAQVIGTIGTKLDDRLRLRPSSPRPDIAKPELREDMQRCRFRAAVAGLDADANVFRVDLGILDDDIEIAVFVEHTRVEQLELGTLTRAALVFVNEPAIGILRLRILVEKAHVGMSRRVVEIEVILLDVFTVVAFARRQSEKALLEDRIATVPECRRKHQELIAIADHRDAVLAPAIGFAARQVVRQKIPSVAVRAIV